MSKSILIDDIIDIIYEKRKAMCVHEINQQIKKLEIQSDIADDIWCYHNKRVAFWDRDHNVHYITSNSNIRSIYLDYQSQRFLNRQWTYVCGDCGEFLIECEPPKHLEHTVFYYCKCNRYVCYG